MAETESEVVSTSKFKVRPLSRQKPVGSRQKAEGDASEPHDSTKRSKQTRLRQLTGELHALEARLRHGGGPNKIDRQHQQGKLTARERIELLLDAGSYSREIGLLVAYDQYKEPGPGGKGQSESDEEIGGAPAAGVVTTIGHDSSSRCAPDFFIAFALPFPSWPWLFILIVSNQQSNFPAVRARIKQQLNPFTRGQLSLLVLTVNLVRAPTVPQACFEGVQLSSQLPQTCLPRSLRGVVRL